MDLQGQQDLRGLRINANHKLKAQCGEASFLVLRRTRSKISGLQGITAYEAYSLTSPCKPLQTIGEGAIAQLCLVILSLWPFFVMLTLMSIYIKLTRGLTRYFGPYVMIPRTRLHLEKRRLHENEVRGD